MGRRKKRTFSTSFKTRIALEALQERKTLTELAQEHELVPSQISAWKKQAIEALPAVFEQNHAKADEQEALTAQLYEKIGRLEMELDWLQKKASKLGSK